MASKKLTVVVSLSVLIAGLAWLYYSQNIAEDRSKTMTSDTAKATEAAGNSVQTVPEPVVPSTSVAGDKGSTKDTADMLIQDLTDTNVEDMLFYDQGIDELGDYVSITDGNIQSMLAGIHREGDKEVSPEQLKTLLDVAGHDILGYKHGDPNMMLSSLLRTSYTFNEDVIDILRKKLVKWYDVKEDEVPPDAEGVLRFYLILNSRCKENRTNLYNEMSVSASRLKFFTTSKPPESLLKQLDRLHDISEKLLWNGYVSPVKFSVSYKNSPEEVVKRHGKLLWVEARIVASDSQDKKYSRLKRYYWSPEDNTWLLMDWASLYARDRLVDEIF